MLKKISSYLRKNPHILVLIFILSLATFFRTYQVIERFDYAHDGDLYSWMVKDIIINHHFRLVGQETSASGIFIGPLYYYLITPFFLLTNMDPVGAIIPITIIGMLTVYSYFWVFSRLFNTNVGLIASFLYAILLETVQIDRLVVPSTPTNLWVIWYFYTIINLARGNFKALPLLGILIGLIWHIHIALIPTLLAIPFAILVSHKLPNFKQVTNFMIALFVTSIPLIVFEIKHNFQQFFSLLNNFTQTHEGAIGFYKFQLVLDMIIKNINNLFFAPQEFKFTQNFFFILAILLSSFYLIKKKLLTKKEVGIFFVWIFGVISFFSLSSSPISEYYFSNLEVIFLAIVSLLLLNFVKSSKLGKTFVIVLLSLVAFKNIYFYITQSYYHKGYLERKGVVDFITSDARNRNFPCFSINYITSPGENVGFRYFFYLKGAKLAIPGKGSPVYNIVIPDEYSLNEVEKRFGHIGVITPKNVESDSVIKVACSGANTNLTDPMFGYVE